MSKFYIHFTDSPTVVLTHFRVTPRNDGCELATGFGSLHYDAEPLFLPSQEAACALISLVRAFNPDGDALFFTEVLDLPFKDV